MEIYLARFRFSIINRRRRHVSADVRWMVTHCVLSGAIRVIDAYIEFASVCCVSPTLPHSLLYKPHPLPTDTHITGGAIPVNLVPMLRNGYRLMLNDQALLVPESMRLHVFAVLSCT